MPSTKFIRFIGLIAGSLVVAGQAGPVLAAPLTVSVKVDQDTFASSGGTVTPGDATANFSGQGAMMIGTPIGTQDRTMMALLNFNTASIKTAMDAEFGAGQWVVTSVGLRLGSNFAQAGVQPNNASFNVIRAGNFEFDYSTNDIWNGSAINWTTLPAYFASTTLTSVGTFYWAADGLTNPAGNPQYTTWALGLVPALTSDLAAGDEVTFIGKPADDQVNYLFNQKTKVGAEPYLDVTAVGVPEPASLALLALAGWLSLRRQASAH